MANAPLTHAMIAREAAAALEELSPFIKNVNKARQEEFGQGTQYGRSHDHEPIADSTGSAANQRGEVRARVRVRRHRGQTDLPGGRAAYIPRSRGRGLAHGAEVW